MSQGNCYSNDARRSLVGFYALCSGYTQTGLHLEISARRVRNFAHRQTFQPSQSDSLQILLQYGPLYLLQILPAARHVLYFYLQARVLV